MKKIYIEDVKLKGEESCNFEPFSVKVLGNMCEENIYAELPEHIVINGKQFVLPINERMVTVQNGKNPTHNVGRDVRKFLRNNWGIVIPFRKQKDIKIDFS